LKRSVNALQDQTLHGIKNSMITRVFQQNRRGTVIRTNILDRRLVADCVNSRTPPIDPVAASRILPLQTFKPLIDHRVLTPHDHLRSLAADRCAGAAAMAPLQERFGDFQLVELIGTIAYCGMLAMTANA
jgi:hypothetical protein